MINNIDTDLEHKKSSPSTTSSPPLSSPPQADYDQGIATGSLPVATSINQPSSLDIPKPNAAHYQIKDLVSWSSGLCACFSDFPNCFVTFWCPCITFGQISEIVDRGSSSCGINGALYALLSYCTCCACIFSCFYRSKMRKQYRLRKSPCGDCLVHFFCEYCALCQEYRHLKSLGFDMSIGYHENISRHNIVMEIPPAVEGSMNRG
ncbi:hypothetical protein FEM48_Zijuj10G0121400 [Ziziphus jujuba var. spinosa]|uniref:Protein PLANT CADMIUM RESISTANCE 2-like n=1 Tax=Ziziphus jujuba var. spinosa TaxID=714518 RepID=A0A978UNA6_ZIZJJ|nr:hypothetical protein FEM48_Zijuj10G0121400 [Ziziphus jujuba var. spinosa]